MKELRDRLESLRENAQARDVYSLELRGRGLGMHSSLFSEGQKYAPLDATPQT